MRVLLVQSFAVLDDPPLYPLGLAYLIAHLAGHEIRFIDLNVGRQALDEACRLVASFRPEAIGISLRNINVTQHPKSHSSCLDPHLAAIRRLRAVAPDVPIICGGNAFSLYAEWFMRHVPEITYGITGEGEISFPQLLGNLAAPQNVRGVHYRDAGGTPRYTGTGPVPDFARMPMPDRTVIPARNYRGDPTSVGVLTKRGCAMQCIHCSDLYLLGRAIRRREPGLVVDEIEQLARDHGVRDIIFNDQVFNYPLEHAEAICRELIRRGVKVHWSAWCSPKYVSAEFFELAEAAGCTHLSFSTDSVSDRVLRGLQKDFSRNDILTCHRLLRRTRFTVTYNFMVNGPGETVGSILQVVAFAIQAKLTMGRRLQLHKRFLDVMRIYPHTELRSLAVQRHLIGEKDDLIEPVYYNPTPLGYVAKLVTGLIRLVWYLKNAARPAAKRVRAGTC